MPRRSRRNKQPWVGLAGAFVSAAFLANACGAASSKRKAFDAAGGGAGEAGRGEVANDAGQPAQAGQGSVPNGGGSPAEVTSGAGGVSEDDTHAAGSAAGGAPGAAGAANTPRVSIVGLFPTGVDDAGIALAGGQPDPHWFLLAPAQMPLVVDPIGGARWVPNTTSYRWVWQQANALPSGNLTFRTTFSLGGLRARTATLTVLCAADESAELVALNGHALDVRCANYLDTSSFTIAAGSPYFVDGDNTLDFTVTDTSLVGGFLVTTIRGDAEAL